MSKRRLKPCPFCGAVPRRAQKSHRVEDRANKWRYVYYLQCPNRDCGARPDVFGYSPSMCARRWNLRSAGRE
jgi:hypothetical protein